jgi:hypothetical protein
MKPMLVIDLETIVDPQMPAGRDKADRYIEYREEGLPVTPLLSVPMGTGHYFQRDTSNDFPVLSRWQICSFGTFSYDLGFRILGFGYDLPGQFSERLALTQIADLVGEHTLVSWNGRRFDVPLIGLRSLAHAIPLPNWYGQRGARYRYSDAAHFDLHDYLTDYGSAHIGHLDQVARLIGFPGKLSGDGTQVAKLVEEKRFDELHRYCLTDVAQTAALAIRVDLLRGELKPLEARQDALSLLNHIDRRKELSELAERIDRLKFLEVVSGT